MDMNILKKTVIPVIAGAVILTAVSDTGAAQARETKHPNYSLAAGEQAVISRGWLDQDVSILADMANYPAIDETNGAKTEEDWTNSGLAKDNSTGIITISDGYHAESKIIGASGDATDDQVLNTITYSNKTGAHTGTMPNFGDVTVSFTKARQNATLSGGFYRGIKIDAVSLYLDGYNDGIQDAGNAKVFNTVTVDPGEFGQWSDGSREAKSFTGPEYTGMTTDVQPVDNIHYQTEWSVTPGNAALVLKANWAERKLVTKIYDAISYGDQIDLSDLYVTKISFGGSSSYEAQSGRAPHHEDIPDVRREVHIKYTDTAITCITNIAFNVTQDGQTLHTMNISDSTHPEVTGSRIRWWNDYDWRNHYESYAQSSGSTEYTFEEPTARIRLIKTASQLENWSSSDYRITVEGYQK